MQTFPNILSYIKYYQDLISLEREESMKAHIDEIRALSPKQRELKGRAILYLQGKYEGRGLGGTHHVRYTKCDRKRLYQNEIGVGDLVIITDKNKPDFNEEQGTVIEKTQYSILVSFMQRPKQYHFKSNLRLDLFSNDITFQRMLIALQKLKSRNNLHRLLLSRQIDNEKENIYSNIPYNLNLDKSQKNAVAKSLISKNLFLLHGPPGTGKTTTLVESIMQHLQLNKKILVTADSNTAVDNILSKLSEYNTKIVRIGNPARVDKKLIQYSLDFQVQKELFYREAKSLYLEADELKKKQETHGTIPSKENRKGLSDKQIRRFAKRRKSSNQVPAPIIRKMSMWLNCQEQIKGLHKKAKIYEDEATKKILNSADIICITNSGSGGNTLENYCFATKTIFDVLFIDEATQATEPSCLIPMMFAKKYIFAGDHMQLPPTILSPNAKDLQYTLFEKLLQNNGKELSSMLSVQYRMNKNIMNFSNTHFYHGKLKAHKSVANHTVENFITPSYDYQKTKWLTETLKPQIPCIFLNTSITSKAYEKRHEGSTSIENEKEAIIIEQIATELIQMGLKQSDIGIITPYNNQVKLLTEKLSHLKDIEIKSVDGFQGREKEVIIISFVRANEEGQIGFLSDKRRLNVAITRAKRKLIMVGHKETLEKDELYKKLISSTNNIGLDA